MKNIKQLEKSMSSEIAMESSFKNKIMKNFTELNEDEVANIIQNISFSSHAKLATALDNGMLAEARTIFEDVNGFGSFSKPGSKPTGTTHTDNSYSQPQQQSTPTHPDELSIGDEVNFVNSNGPFGVFTIMLILS